MKRLIYSMASYLYIISLLPMVHKSDVHLWFIFLFCYNDFKPHSKEKISHHHN